jgi:hypothetical protein
VPCQAPRRLAGFAGEDWHRRQVLMAIH